MPSRGKLWKDRLRGHKNGVFYLRMIQDTEANDRNVDVERNPDRDDLLLSVSFDASLRVWDLRQRIVRRKLSLSQPKDVLDEVQDSHLTACIVDDVGQGVIGGMMNGLVAEWCGKTGEFISEIGRHENAVSAVLRKGDTIYTGSWDSTLRIWERCGVEWVAKLILDLQVDAYVENPISQMVFLDAQLLVGSWDGHLRVLSIEPAKCLQAIEVFQCSGIRCVATHKVKDHWYAYAGTEDRFISAWKLSEKPVCVAHWKAHNSNVTALLISTLGKDVRLFSASDDGMVRIWDPINAYMYDEFHAHDGAVLALFMVPNLLYCASRDTTIRNFETDEILKRIRERTGMRLADLQSHRVQIYQQIDAAGRKKTTTKSKAKKKR